MTAEELSKASTSKYLFEPFGTFNVVVTEDFPDTEMLSSIVVISLAVTFILIVVMLEGIEEPITEGVFSVDDDVVPPPNVIVTGVFAELLLEGDFEFEDESEDTLLPAPPLPQPVKETNMITNEVNNKFLIIPPFL
ncbi:hypothetical protein E2O03_009930 [Candidatus Magnetomonas plexicatena]|nr:hypothetical protein E2O03_009930 [Nitrospirales bacterium LBB_01]